MNPAQFPNMGMQSVGPQGMPQQGGLQRPANPMHAAQTRIYQLIQHNQQQYLPQGWQTTLPTQQRAANVYQIFSQVRLIKNDMTVDNAIQVAITFEQKTFQESLDKAQYEQTCRSKMEDIARTRNQLAKSMQQQLQSGHHIPVNMNQQPMPMQGFPNLNQQQQQLQIQQQQNMAQRLMQQQQNQVQGMVVPSPAQPMGNLQARMQGMPPNMPQPMPTQQQPKYTPQEQQEITRKSQELLTNASQNQEHMNKLRQILQHNNPNMDLNQLLYRHFQAQAIRWFEGMKKMAAARAGQLIPGPNGASVAQQGQPMPQNSSRIPNQQPTPVSASQTFDPSFMGSVDQMRLSALREQEAGQVVVPESQPQRTMGGGPQANNQNVVNRPVQTPQIPQQPPQSWNQQNGQAPQQTNVYPNSMNGVPQNTLQGQQGGLSNVARTPQQNANMPNLNRAFGPQSTQPNTQPQQSTPQMGQRNPANAQQVMQNGVPRLPSGITQAQLQQRLQQLPEAERKAVLMRMQAAQKEQQQNNQGMQMQSQRSQQGQPMPVIPQPAPRTAQQMNAHPQQPVNGPNQAQPPISQRNGLQVQAALAASRSLTNEQEQQMDNHPYPPGILNTGNALSQLPPGIKTWGQLKNWVKMNSNTLPPGSEHKLRGLQGLHYQNLQQPKKGLQPPAMRTTAPPAPMTPRPNQGSANLQIPQPTPQEIINLRAKHPQLASLTDDQIRGMVMQQRTQEMMRRREEAQARMVMYQRQVSQNPSQTPVIQPGQPQQPPSSAQRPQPQQPAKPGVQAKSQSGTMPQVPAPSSGPQKGIKRPSSDDVVEVPNPNINQQSSPPKPKAPPANMVPQKPTETQKFHPMPREKLSAQPSQIVTQTPPKITEASKTEDRYRAIIGEVRQSTPQRQPVPMDADARRKMLERLASARDLITRMAQFLPVFFKVFNDEDGLRTLARVYLTLAQQYKNEQVKLASPVEHFTIGLDELEGNINTLKAFFNNTMERMNRQKNGVLKAAEPAKETIMPELNKANLQKHQDNIKLQREQMQRESNRAPLAPTQAQLPPWGPSSSPDGAPIYPVQNQFPQDKLHIPPTKKLRTPSSTPAPIPAASPLVKKSPEFLKTPAPVMLRCPVSNCSDTKGFASQIDLDKHMVEHETREPNIDDPFKFALEQMQFALNLDKNGKLKPKVGADPNEAPKMEKSASLQGIKRDPATPMSRVPTGPSPASHSKTPQAAKAAAPFPNALPDVVLPEDPWADSLVRPETIQEAFSPLSTLTGPKTWTKMQDYLTPESSSDATDPSKSSPRLSDVSENDAVKISLDTGLSQNWIPLSWTDADLRHVDDFELLDLNVDQAGAPADQMDWEAMFDETDEEALARADKEKIRVERDLARGGTGVPDEFARIHGRGEMQPRPPRR